jgi:fibro-slime domain-containing protein
LEPIGAGRFQFSSSDGDTIADDIAEGAGAELDSGFFPLDDQNGVGSTQMCNMWPYWVNFPGCSGDQWNPDANDGNGGMENYDGMEHDFYFTSEVRYLFKYVGGEKLEFYGDDDVFVYINGKLTLDLGAPHERLLGDVVLSDTNAVATVYEADGDETVTQVPMMLTPGNTYEIAVFHADRHPRESNYQLTLQGFSTTHSECLPDCGDGTPTTGEECDDGPDNNNATYGGCTTECKFGPFCGDGVPDTEGGFEECDNGRDNTATYNTPGGCTPACLWAPFCGDGKIDANFGEQCDQGDMNAPGGSCTDKCEIGVK